MRPITFIRTDVFKETQKAFGRIAGVSQGTVSRWEAGDLAPAQAEMIRIRNAAIRLGLPWDDAWFFVLPTRQLAALSEGLAREALA
ncbi:helix-turn-helix domain-containing protein [Aureimonas mangrovi]|uniref:helix-turn-helix transcriptional regulator n=1 Tax=Aureimonas mangrovi TaxID=2758041 RepID=UPI00163DA1BF